MAGWESADNARKRLELAGVCVDLEGAVRFTSEAERLYTSTPWVQDIHPCPRKHPYHSRGSHRNPCRRMDAWAGTEAYARQNLQAP